MSLKITALASYLPGNPVTNEEIINANSLRMKGDWVENRLGIKFRHWADAETASSDLAVAAAKQLGLEGFSGPIFLSTISPDYFTPSTASLVKFKLGLKDSHAAIDLNNACAGLMFALACADAWLQSHQDVSEALIIASEIRSKYLNKKDRRTVFLFGDGAVALRVSKTSGPGGLEWIETHTAAAESNDIYVPGGGSAQPLDEAGLSAGQQYINMVDGEKITRMATESLAEQIGEILKKHGAKVEDYELILSHQANQSVNDKLFALLGVKPEQTYTTLWKTGNCSSASIGFALVEAVKEGKLKSGQKMLMVTMGAGYHFSVASFRW